MKNLFSVGEAISLQSPNLSEYNGEYTIHAIVQPNENFTCRLTGLILYTTEGVSYVLDEPLLDLVSCEGTETFWAPSSLRKKHNPSGFSFNELMADLKTNITEPTTAIK